MYIDQNISIGVDGFLTFADFFWDGLLSTFAMQDKINSAIKKVQGVKYQIQDTINILNSKIVDMDNQISQTAEKLK